MIYHSPQRKHGVSRAFATFYNNILLLMHCPRVSLVETPIIPTCRMEPTMLVGGLNPSEKY